MSRSNDRLFSQELTDWLNSKGSKTVGSLEEIFDERSFAVAFFLLLAPSALPIPTGGITWLFEALGMLLSFELIIGRRTIWIPAKWRQRSIGKNLRTKALPKLVRFIAWFEKRSQQRLTGVLDHPWFLRLTGLIVFLFTLTSFVAVPFSGLDTLPALGVVIISLALIMGDALLMIFGLLVGSVGVLLAISLGSAALRLLHF